MIAIFARLVAVSLAVTALALIVVAFSPRAQAQNAAAGAVAYRSFPALCADCHNADECSTVRGNADWTYDGDVFGVGMCAPP